MVTAKAGSKDQVERRYRAPALDKGLDILELLAKERHPLTTSMIGQKLGRSMSELFRMIQVLEYRGFIQQAESGEGYFPTDKLFALGMERAPIKNLLEFALPIMRELSVNTGQSCHLVMRSKGEIVVVARMESGEQLGFSVRVGYRKPLTQTCSGRVLFAFQDEADRRRWEESFAPDTDPRHLEEFHASLGQVRKNGFARTKSGFVTGVTDISAPILRGPAAAAALTIPFVHSTQLVMPIDMTIKHLRSAAAQISASLTVSDHRI